MSLNISYKHLIAIPLILLTLSTILIIAYGVDMGVEFKGGTLTTIKLTKPIGAEELERVLRKTLQTPDVRVVVSQTREWADVETTLSQEEFDETVLNATLTKQNIGQIRGISVISPALSATFQKDALRALTVAFVIMGVVVIICFRVFVPAGAVILAAVSDIIITLAAMSLFDVRLSLATVAALLMLIGYSVDTDILLTTRILKRKKGRIVQRIQDAMKTGLTMSGTTMAAMVVMYLASSFLMIEVLRDIAIVLIIGLLVDLMNTWVQNAGILRWHLEKVEG